MLSKYLKSFLFTLILTTTTFGVIAQMVADFWMYIFIDVLHSLTSSFKYVKIFPLCSAS
jgi:hypothetical protein